MILRSLSGCNGRFFDLEIAFLDQIFLHCIPHRFLNLQVDIQSLFGVEISENILQDCSLSLKSSKPCSNLATFTRGQR